ncbi:MAG: carbohydrate-binding domain-containing protein [Lachnospiraceae bacterium]|nr:carbohydrate-binding domain-containing protein [Lachnospiraceae bacterium]
MNKNNCLLKMTAMILATILVLSACGGRGTSPTTSAQQGSAASDQTTAASDQTTAASITEAGTTPATSEPAHATDPASQGTAATGDFTVLAAVSGGVTQEGSVYTITAEGKYSFSGSLSDGQIVVNAPDQKVEIILSGAAISCSTDAPIKILDADKVTITVEGYNEVTDARALRTDDEAEAEEKAAGGAVYAKCDLTLAGTGSLVVTGGYNNGVHTTKDLKVKELTLKVSAPNNALKGNDSVTVESGSLLLISSGGDGIKTEDSDVSSKGNQRGTVTVSGGTIDIYAACDGIDAAYDAVISKGDAVLNIYTDTYSPYTGEALSTGTKFYLIMSQSLYQSHSLFAAYYYNDDESAGVWAKASYAMEVYGGRTAYAALSLTAPSGYENVAYFAFDSDTPSTEAYAATTGGGTVNRTVNAILLQESGNALSGDYVSLSLSGSSTSSAKGIKADNEILIADCTLTIQSTDDAIHANDDVTLENGSQGLGNVTIAGGTLTLSSGDDGIHGDGTVTVDGGVINILTAYEGVEGNVVVFNGGETYVNAKDDGVNAKSGSSTPLIQINGGLLKVTVGSGDTDGMDSNGNIVMTGGFVLVQSGSSMGGMAGSVDLDGTISVTGGTLVALGGICETPNGSGDCCTVLMSGQSFAAGEYTVTDGSKTLFSFTVDASCQSGWIASNTLSQGGSYQILKDGSSVYSWSQTSQSVGSGGSSWGGPGGGGWRR